MRARLRFAALALPALVLAACEDAPPPETSVTTASVAIPGGEDSCQLLTTNEVQPALAPPSQSPAPTPPAGPATAHVVKVAGTTVGGALKPNFVVDQCTYSDVGGQAIVVTVYAPQQANGFTGQLADLNDLTQNATQITIGTTTAYYTQTVTGAVLALQRSAFSVTFAYPSGEPAGGPSREQRLANLAAAMLSVAPPSLPPVTAPIAAASPTASATPAAPAGQPTSGATAAVVVNETDALVFQSNDISVKVGDVVQWKNTGSLQHNVVFGGQATINSPTMNGGDTFEVKFTTAGAYSYVCTFHVSSGMTGKVTVHS
jgi:plastocyanin